MSVVPYTPNPHGGPVGAVRLSRTNLAGRTAPTIDSIARIVPLLYAVFVANTGGAYENHPFPSIPKINSIGAGFLFWVFSARVIPLDLQLGKTDYSSITG